MKQSTYSAGCFVKTSRPRVTIAMSSLSNNNVCLTWVYLYGDISLNPKHLENIMYKVEKNVPLMPITRNGTAEHKYPFLQMNVGDMFSVPVDPATALGYVRVRARVSTAVWQHMKRNQVNGNAVMCFTTRSDKSHNCIRVWRIA